MFSPEAVARAKSRLERLERVTRIPVVIETIAAIPGLDRQAGREDKERAINRLAEQRDKEIRDEGIYILISKRDRVISNTLIRARLANLLPIEKRRAIRDAFIAEFKKQDFDGGLDRAVRTIEESLAGVAASNRAPGPGGTPAPFGRAGHAGGGPSMMGTLLLIGLGIIAVLVVLRLLGGLFSRSAGAGYPGPMGGPGMSRPGMGPGPGAGPGYSGGPGYGGRGGGFFSGLLGGLGGALAGNWLYDQMSGRHGGQMTSGSAYPTEESSAGLPDQGGDAIIGAEDDQGRGASWDDGGGTDAGGGDWGGGDAGGDWGGGDVGGDWGGGGGDWGGGGDGGGDW